MSDRRMLAPMYAVRGGDGSGGFRADGDKCYSAWCYVEEHAKRYTKAEATKLAKFLGGTVVRLEEPSV